MASSRSAVPSNVKSFFSACRNGGLAAKSLSYVWISSETENGMASNNNLTSSAGLSAME